MQRAQLLGSSIAACDETALSAYEYARAHQAHSCVALLAICRARRRVRRAFTTSNSRDHPNMQITSSRTHAVLHAACRPREHAPFVISISPDSQERGARRGSRGDLAGETFCGRIHSGKLWGCPELQTFPARSCVQYSVWYLGVHLRCVRQCGTVRMYVSLWVGVVE